MVANGSFLLLGGQPTVVTTVVANSTVSVDVPAAPPGSTAIAQLVVGTPTAPTSIVPIAPFDRFVEAITVEAFDAGGSPIHELAAPLTIQVTLPSPAGVNGAFARVYTVDSSGNTQMLATSTVGNADGTYTATATTTHLSPFAIYGPGRGTPVPQVFIPVAFAR
jgi:hypothetical protein